MCSEWWTPNKTHAETPLVGGWATPLKNMTSSTKGWGHSKPNKNSWENAKFMATSYHQPVMGFRFVTRRLRRLLGSSPSALGSHQSSARQRRKPPGTYFLGTSMPSQPQESRPPGGDALEGVKMWPKSWGFGLAKLKTFDEHLAKFRRFYWKPCFKQPRTTGLGWDPVAKWLNWLQQIACQKLRGALLHSWSTSWAMGRVCYVCFRISAFSLTKTLVLILRVG